MERYINQDPKIIDGKRSYRQRTIALGSLFDGRLLDEVLHTRSWL
uniref:Transposase n=1 Tax=Steinernema glaseri TaxID=37863 RepID=A0A1I7Z8F2_9BILA